MGEKITGFVAALLMVTVACGGEPKPKPLLLIEDQVYEVRDFENFLRLARPGDENFDSELLSGYLEEFRERKLLAFGAARAGVEPPRGVVSSFDRENRMISSFIALEAAKRERQMQISEESISRLYDEKYKDERARLSTIYIESDSDAKRMYRELRSRPSRFDQYMERYNTEEVQAEGRGQGIHSRMQIPEILREAVFALERAPQVLEPMVYQGGYLIVLVHELLPRPSLEEVREDLEGTLVFDLRSRLKHKLIDELSASLTIEFNPELAVSALGGAREKEEEEQR